MEASISAVCLSCSFKLESAIPSIYCKGGGHSVSGGVGEFCRKELTGGQVLILPPSDGLLAVMSLEHSNAHRSSL